MPSLAQEDLPRDPRILKALAQHNRIDVAGALFPCAGVYAVAEATGTIRKGDSVRLVTSLADDVPLAPCDAVCQGPPYTGAYAVLTSCTSFVTESFASPKSITDWAAR